MRSGYKPAVAALFVLLSGVVLAITQTQKTTAPPRSRPTPPPRKGSITMPQTGWKEVDKLIDEQKFEEASTAVARIREAARAAGQENEWTKALIREVQLRTGLHGYETSVRFLKDQPWPKGSLDRSTLNLFYGSSLVTYSQAYGWEIGQRERVDTKGVVDLKAWTKDQLYEEATKAYLDVWKEREALGQEPVKRLAEYVALNNYPEGIRGTLRDAATYLFVELLSNTAGWRPEQSNDLFRLDLPSLVRGDFVGSKQVLLADPAVHPLVRIGALLDDLEAWHGAKTEGGLEARLERLRRLAASFSDEKDRAPIRKHLESILPAFEKVPWFSVGKAELADLVRATGDLVKARRIAEEGRAAHPGSVGGQRCLSIVKQIEAPDYQLSSMSSDAAGKRSILLSHKNLPRMHFRAYTLDVVKRVESASDYNLMPQGEELRKLVTATKPVAEWSVDLPRTPDFNMHKTFVTPPMKTKAFYVVVASAKPDFKSGDNRIIAAFLNVTDLVLVIRNDAATGNLEVTTLSGETGNPISGVSLALYKYDWNKKHEKVETKVSDATGVARFDATAEKTRNNHFLIGRKGDDLALDASYLSFWRPQAPGERTGALVYTDRSIYRPMQKLFWKVVVYGGKDADATFAVRPQMPVTMNLYDPNNQVVETRTVTTNEYGSAAGEFVVPTGRVLGSWRVWASANGQANVRVEEYKRPTFETTFKDPKEPLRLNRPATLLGEAKYYFGLPVVNGTVKWRVTRQPVFPWWWWWWNAPAANPQTIATGVTALKEDGSFQLTFTPEADEKQTSREVSYRYQASVDITDEGGETRSASRGFRLGFVSVEGRIDTGVTFYREGEKAEASFARTDLDGVPRAGKASWRLVGLKQPETTILPAEQRLKPGESAEGEESAEETKTKTPGDPLRPRWEATGYTPERMLRDWPDGVEKGRGPLAHDEKGAAKVALPELAAGAYRLFYETVDDFGAPFKASKDFLVAGKKTSLNLPAVLMVESTSVPVGGTARVFVLSGLLDQTLFYDVYRAGKLVERKRLASKKDANLIEIPVTEKDRGGFGVTLSLLRDHQFLQFTQSVFVPWDNKQLKVEFATFRDKMRPGAKETWKVTVRGNKGAAVESGAAELLSYMYDKSLDIFAPHYPPSPLSLYPNRSGAGTSRATLGVSAAQWFDYGNFNPPPGYPTLIGDRLKFFDGYGIGGPGRRNSFAGGKNGAFPGRARSIETDQAAPASEAMPAPALQAMAKGVAGGVLGGVVDKLAEKKDEGRAEAPAQAPAAPVELRSNFAETAFWKPNLLLEADGSTSFEFTVPDSVTAWNVWVHGVTKDLRAGSIHKETKSVKELMVRPYVPRFLREGDQAEIKVVVNNASEREMSGRLTFDILDPLTNLSVLKDFGLADGGKPFTVKAGGGTNLTFPLTAPKRVGLVAFKVTATSGDLSDGELRPIPLLPSRVHLAQSRFVTLHDKDRKTLTFADLAKNDDPTLINEQMVVTVDAQLFYTVLQALPYLVNYPYECTEQTLNRFVSTGIVSKLYKDYPAIATMASEFAKRETPLETFDAADPNRKMTLEESPWLETAKGGKDAGYGMTNVLDPRVAKADRDVSLAKLRKAQTANGSFPWWPGGPPSPYMTLYIMHGFAKATEFGVDVPKDMVQRGWAYLASHFREDWQRMRKDDCCWEFLTFLNYVASCYPDESWTNNALTMDERKQILDFSFRHWKRHSPYLKGYLSLTLKRMGRLPDAQLVWASVMDSAKSNDEQGTFWAQEDRSWLWYNDTIESHAFALRTLTEIEPKNPKKDGLVQWLLINKKLNQWKSTRATAEVIYSLIHYLKAEGALGIAEDATVTVGAQKVQFTFAPDKYTGKKNQIVIPGDKIDPKTTSTVIVEKESKGFAFASATWHFSTDRLPAEDRGDFFSVSRKYFKRENTGREWVLKPLADGATLQPGDQIEVQLSLRTKHRAEYVHLRDPRAAGLEPENAVSRYKWDLGISWYEETRDSGSNFFFESLPVGEYTFKYRLRANMAGTFRVGPATVQSMYAPEFNAYSAGHVLKVVGEGK